MENKRNRKSVLIASCVLAGLIVAGSTFAWFTSRDEVVNKISASNEYNVVAKEDFTPPDNWIPGQTVKKEAGAVNTGNVPAFVKATVSGNIVLTQKAENMATSGTDFKDKAEELSQDEVISKQAGGLLVYSGTEIENGTQVKTVQAADKIDSGSVYATEAGYYIFARSTTQNDSGKTTAVVYEGYYYDGEKFYDIDIKVDDSGKVSAGILQAESVTINADKLQYSFNDDGTVRVTYTGADETAGTADDIMIDIELSENVSKDDTKDWTVSLNEADQSNAVFYYNKLLEGGAATANIISAVTLDSKVQNDAFYAMDYNLNFKIESAQLVNDGESAEEAVNAQSWAVKKAKLVADGKTVSWTTAPATPENSDNNNGGE